MEIGELIIRSPIAKSLAIIGDVWAFRILQEIFSGNHRFESFINKTGASRATLSKRLQSLANHEIIEKIAYQASPQRFEYHLTEKGKDLFDFFLIAWQWEEQWRESDDESHPKLFHQACGQPLEVGIECSHCGENVRGSNVRFKAGPGLDTAPVINLGEFRRAKNKNPDSESNDASAIEVLSDRWTPFVLATALFGLHKFDEIQQQLSIATNILSDRLKLLVDNKLLAKNAYQSNPVRYDYHLTDKGKGFYKLAIILNQWGERWLMSDEEQSALILHHHCTEDAFKTKLICKHCKGSLSWEAVSRKN